MAVWTSRNGAPSTATSLKCWCLQTRRLRKLSLRILRRVCRHTMFPRPRACSVRRSGARQHCSRGRGGPGRGSYRSALETLPKLAAENRGPFDLIFIDADKANNAEYFAWVLKLSRPGSVIVGDNVVRGGALVDTESDDPRTQGVRRFHELIAAEPSVTATTIQTVGSKGYDGFTIALVIADSQPGSASRS